MPGVGEKSRRELFELFSDNRSDNDQEKNIHIEGLDYFCFKRALLDSWLESHPLA